MATTIHTDNPDTRELLERVLELGGYVDMDDLLYEMLVQRFLAVPQVRDQLAKKIKEGLDSESLPWNAETQAMIRERTRTIAREVEREKAGE